MSTSGPRAIRTRLRHWNGVILALQTLLFVLYVAFWLDPTPTDDITMDVVVFIASPFVFAVAFVAGVFGIESRGHRRTVSASAVGNTLMGLCLLWAVGIWLLFAFAALAFRLE